MSDWSPDFLALRPSAAKVFAIAWHKKATALLEERKISAINSEILQEAFQKTFNESSSLPVRDQICRLLTLHCAVLLLANYHPHGKDVDKSVRPMRWSDSIWNRYLKMLHQHGLEMKIDTPGVST